ncbi:MAG: hypothetical protein IRZ16_04405 [Myxococcaceae bacterium]|nr:hypothetical protein [Myxococcaceae bacterium]
MTRLLLVPVAVILAAGAGCKKTPDKPVAGLLAAGAPLYMETRDGRRPIAVGSELRPSDRVSASGPAAIEYFGGATLFLEDGDGLEIGEAEEAKRIGPTLPESVLRDGVITPSASAPRIIAARYHSVEFTPQIASNALGTSDYLRAFFTPNGIERLQNAPMPEGPRKPLPPPPHRPKVPHVHAGELGEGGAELVVDDGFVVAESDDLATAVLPEGQAYALGRTRRLMLPEDAEATLATTDGRQLKLEGPLDLRLR